MQSVVKFEGEGGETYSRSSVTGTIARQIRNGVI